MLQDLGWANEWREKPAVVVECERQCHDTSNTDVGPKFRGLEHIVACEKCGYLFRYDSSD